MSEDMFPWEEEQHYYRHKVEINLALVAVDACNSTNTRFVISKHTSSLPHKPLAKGGSSFAIAKAIFKELTGSDADPWFLIKQVGTLDQIKDDTVVILYAILIPNIVPLVDGQSEWVDFTSLAQYPDLLCMMGQACNYYRAT